MDCLSFYYLVDEKVLEEITDEEKAVYYINEFGRSKEMRRIYYMMKTYKNAYIQVISSVDSNHREIRFAYHIKHGATIPEGATKIDVSNLYCLFKYTGANRYYSTYFIESEEEMNFNPYFMIGLYYIYGDPELHHKYDSDEQILDIMERNKKAVMYLVIEQLINKPIRKCSYFVDGFAKLE